MIIVSDTSPLCSLQLINYLWLLREIYGKVIIPDVVSDELKNATNPDIKAICNLSWVKIQSVKDVKLAQKLQNQGGLDRGEAYAISLAIELQADELLIDERLGRREAEKLGVSIIGLLGVLIIAKKRKLIFNVQEVMDNLITVAGFRVSNALYQKVLMLSDEI
jgi:predicted nucleic acid-binding protein